MQNGRLKLDNWPSNSVIAWKRQLRPNLNDCTRFCNKWRKFRKKIGSRKSLAKLIRISYIRWSCLSGSARRPAQMLKRKFNGSSQSWQRWKKRRVKLRRQFHCESRQLKKRLNSWQRCWMKQISGFSQIKLTLTTIKTRRRNWRKSWIN